MTTDSSVRTRPRSSLTSGLRKAKTRSWKTGTQAVRQATCISECQLLPAGVTEKIEGARWEPLRDYMVSLTWHARGLAVRNLREGETAAATVFCHVSLTSPGVQ